MNNTKIPDMFIYPAAISTEAFTSAVAGWRRHWAEWTNHGCRSGMSEPMKNVGVVDDMYSCLRDVFDRILDVF